MYMALVIPKYIYITKSKGGHGVQYKVLEMVNDSNFSIYIQYKDLKFLRPDS